MLPACARKKARHNECARCGAGRRPAPSSTLRTDVAETGMPSPLSSPTIRLYPQCGFSLANRRISSRSEDAAAPAATPARTGSGRRDTQTTRASSPPSTMARAPKLASRTPQSAADEFANPTGRYGALYGAFRSKTPVEERDRRSWFLPFGETGYRGLFSRFQPSASISKAEARAVAGRRKEPDGSERVNPRSLASTTPLPRRLALLAPVSAENPVFCSIAGMPPAFPSVSGRSGFE